MRMPREWCALRVQVSWAFSRIGASLRVPELHALALLDRLRASQRHAREDYQHVPERVRAQLARRRGDGLLQHDEAAYVAQRAAHDDFLRAEECLVETAHRSEGLARAEDEATCRESEAMVYERER